MSFKDPRQYACTKETCCAGSSVFYFHKIYGVRKLIINHSVEFTSVKLITKDPCYV